MENSLITSLDQVINSIKKLNAKYATLENVVKEYEDEIELLKVEVEIYKEELTNIKIATETKNVQSVKEINSPINQSTDLPQSDEKLIKSDTPIEEVNDKNEQLKMQLDEFIEEIDQCIKTIVTKK